MTSSVSVVVSLNGDEILRSVGRSISGIVALVGAPLPDFSGDPSVLEAIDAVHADQHRDFIGRMPAFPSERLKGRRSLVCALIIDGRTVGVGFREDDDLRVELVPADDVHTLSPDPAPARDPER